MSKLFQVIGLTVGVAALAVGCSESGETATTGTTAAAVVTPAASTMRSSVVDSASNSSYAQAIRRVIGQKDQVVSQTGGGGAVSPETGKAIASKLSALDLGGTPSDFQAAFQKVISALSSVPTTSNAAPMTLPNLSVSQWAPLAGVTSAIAQLEAVCQKYGVMNAGGTLKP